MTNTANTTDDPAVTGVPPETPASVRSSATGIVVGPADGPTDLEAADVRVDELPDSHVGEGSATE